MINTNLNSSRYTTHLMIILVRRDSSEPSITLDSFFFKEGKGPAVRRIDSTPVSILESSTDSLPVEDY